MNTTCTEVNLDELLGPSLTEAQARVIYRYGEETVVLGFMLMARKLAALNPNMESGGIRGHIIGFLFSWAGHLS
jgi:hypothetical protein